MSKDFTEVFKAISPIGNTGYSDEDINRLLNKFTTSKEYLAHSNKAHFTARYIRDLKKLKLSE